MVCSKALMLTVKRQFTRMKYQHYSKKAVMDQSQSFKASAYWVFAFVTKLKGSHIHQDQLAPDHLQPGAVAA